MKFNFVQNIKTCLCCWLEDKNVYILIIVKIKNRTFLFWNIFRFHRIVVRMIRSISECPTLFLVITNVALNDPKWTLLEFISGVSHNLGTWALSSARRCSWKVAKHFKKWGLRGGLKSLGACWWRGYGMPASLFWSLPGCWVAGLALPCTSTKVPLCHGPKSNKVNQLQINPTNLWAQ